MEKRGQTHTMEKPKAETRRPKVGEHSLFSTNWFALVALVFLCGLIYANALDNQFVLDDYDLIVNNSQIRSLDKIPDILGFGNAPRRYRPVRFVSYAFDSFLFGLEPWGYHLSNLVYHIATAFLVYLITRHLVGSAFAAFLTAGLFAVHPIQTETVTFISGRRDVLSTLFYMLAFYAFLKYRALGQIRHLFILGPTFVLGLFTKEIVVTLPVMMLCYDWYVHFPTTYTKIDRKFFRGIFTTLWVVLRKYRIFYVPILVVAGIFLIDKLILHNPSHMKDIYESTYFLHLLSICRILVTYLTLMCFPLTLNADYSYNTFPVTTSLFEPATLSSVVVLALVSLGLLKALQKQKLAAFGGIWFFITLLPVSQIVPHHEPMAEHYLYLPSFGFCLLLALGLERLFASPRTRSYAYAFTVAFFVLYSVRTIVRNQDWQNDMTLWTKTVQTAPNSARAHFNLGQVLFTRGQLDPAMNEYQKAIGIWATNPRLVNENIQGSIALAHFYLGQVLERKGLMDEALDSFQSAIFYGPRYAKAHYKLGTVYFKKGLWEKAIAQFRTTLSIQPTFWQANRNLGIIYQEQGESAKAIEVYKLVLAKNPIYVNAHLNLARLYLEQSHKTKSKHAREQALAHLKAVLTLVPHHSEAQAIKHTMTNLN